VLEILSAATPPRRERGVLVNSTVKTIMFWVFILICLMMLWAVVQRGTSMGKDTEIAYSDLFDKAQAGLVQDAAIEGTELHGHCLLYTSRCV